MINWNFFNSILRTPSQEEHKTIVRRLKVSTNEKRGGLKVVVFVRSPFKGTQEFWLRF
jgi:hypothetical protein